MCINLWVSDASRQASAEYLFCSTKSAHGGGECVGNFGFEVDVEKSIRRKDSLVGRLRSYRGALLDGRIA